MHAQQRDYRKDSLQFKVYTRLYVDTNLGIDSVVVKKVFCDFCSDTQTEFLRNEAYKMTLIERYNPKYQQPGEHRVALYMRYSKDFFKKLNSNE